MAIQFTTENQTPNGNVVGVIECDFKTRTLGGRVEFWPVGFKSGSACVTGPFVHLKTSTDTASLQMRVNAAVSVLCGMLGERVTRAAMLLPRMNIDEFWRLMAERGFPCENHG
jgi:hypothetical protein